MKNYLLLNLLICNKHPFQTTSFSQTCGNNPTKLSKIKYILILLIISFANMNAQVNQEWVSRYTGSGLSFDGATSIAVDNLRNVFVTGASMDSITQGDITTIKYSSLGVQQWVMKYNGSANNTDQALAIVVDNMGNVYVTGRCTDTISTTNFVTIKYNTLGIVQWVDIYDFNNGNDEATAIAIDSLANIYVTGKSSETYTTIKYNSSGVRQWIKKLAGYIPHSIAVDNSGNVFVTGAIDRGTTGLDYGTVKYNSLGNQQWVSFYHGSLSNLATTDEATAIKLDSYGNAYVTGGSYGYNEGAVGYATIKYDTEGNQLWVRRYTGANGYQNSYANALVLDSLRNVHVTGYSINDNKNNFVTIKYDSSGNNLWTTTYNGNPQFLYGSGFANSMVLDKLGNLYVAGYFHWDFISSNDYVIIKYNQSGVQQWLARYNGEANDGDASGLNSLAIDYLGNIYITGSSTGIGTNTDFATIKYSPIIPIEIKLIIEGFYRHPSNRLNMRDTVIAYLRNIVSPYQLIDSAKSVIDSLNYKGSFLFKNTQTGTYFIIVKHRNSIETWSRDGGEIYNIGSVFIYDFTTSISKAYGNNLILQGSRYCIYSGDVNQDGLIDVSDFIEVENDAYNLVTGSFITTDLTGDGVVDLSDFEIVDNNTFNYISTIRP
ncbi:MAG: SBBP repeat-containing protein [Bacteroidota bacterium]|nr:SBBP repeat-containing protein [Bacteroidota bacterium]